MIVQCHEILGIRRSAQAHETKAALRELARKYHPDVMRGQDFYRQEKMKLINLAYASLRNGEKEIHIDDSWWELISSLEKTHLLMQKHQGMMVLTNGAPQGVRKEVLSVMNDLVATAQAFLETGKNEMDLKDRRRLDYILKRVRSSHLEWESKKGERLEVARREARAELEKGEALRRTLLSNGLLGVCPADFEPTGSGKALAASLLLEDEGLLRRCIIEYREKVDRQKNWAKETKIELDEITRELEALLQQHGGEYAVRYLLRKGADELAAECIERTMAALAAFDAPMARKLLFSLKEALEAIERRQQALELLRTSVGYEVEAAFASVAEMGLRGAHSDDEAIGRLREVGRTACIAAQQGDFNLTRQSMREFRATYLEIRSSQSWQQEIALMRMRGTELLDESKAILVKATGAMGFGVWNSILENLGASLSEEDEDTLSLVRSFNGAQDLILCLLELKDIMKSAESSARALFQMTHKGYFISAEETVRVRELRLKLRDSASKGKLVEMRSCAARLESLVNANESRFSQHSRVWKKLAERRDALRRSIETMNSEPSPAESDDDVASRIARGLKDLDVAFVEWNADDMERCLNDLEDLDAQRTSDHSGFAELSRSAAQLIELAQKRMNGKECTCCWASPSERRKARARIRLLRELDDARNVGLLRLAVLDMQAFIIQHDAGHDDSRELRTRAFEALLAAESLLNGVDSEELKQETAAVPLFRKLMARVLREEGNIEGTGLSESISSLLEAIAAAEMDVPVEGSACSDCEQHGGNNSGE